jgi:hypothetical protein
MDELMKPTYHVKIWPDGDWWLARVIAASDNAEGSPLNALTQARSLAKIGPMARDLIATILDIDEETFDVSFVYELPARLNDLVSQARGAREWAEAAQELWQQYSTRAARVLSADGYSLREIATLLGLSYQRVDQLLESPVERKLHSALVYWGGLNPSKSDITWSADAQYWVAFRNLEFHGREGEDHDGPLVAQMRDKIRALTKKLAAEFQRAAEAELERVEAS